MTVNVRWSPPQCADPTGHGLLRGVCPGGRGISVLSRHRRSAALHVCRSVSEGCVLTCTLLTCMLLPCSAVYPTTALLMPLLPGHLALAPDSPDWNTCMPSGTGELVALSCAASWTHCLVRDPGAPAHPCCARTQAPPGSLALAPAKVLRASSSSLLWWHACCLL